MLAVLLIVVLAIAAVPGVAATRPGRFRIVGWLMGLLLNMDRYLGREFEHGLAQLRQVTEDRAHA